MSALSFASVVLLECVVSEPNAESLLHKKMYITTLCVDTGGDVSILSSRFNEDAELTKRMTVVGNKQWLVDLSQDGSPMTAVVHIIMLKTNGTHCLNNSWASNWVSTL